MSRPAAVISAVETAEVFEPGPETVDQAVARLAALSGRDYDLVRKAEAKRLGMRLGTLDRDVKLARHSRDNGRGTPTAFFDDPEPWATPVDGSELLDRLTAITRRHLVLLDGAAETVALWVLFAHAHECFGISPILAVTSPTPECGKTTLMTLLGALVPRRLAASNISPAAVFRAVDAFAPTLLIDEADSFLPNNEELRGILNSGHQRANAFVLRVEGDDYEPRRFSTWAPKAIALIGKLPATLASRSIHIELRRMMTAEKVDPLRPDRLDYLEQLKPQAARWVADNSERLRLADPEMPAALYGRAADNWRPLIAIADLAGRDWPARARRIAEMLGGRGEKRLPASCC